MELQEEQQYGDNSCRDDQKPNISSASSLSLVSSLMEVCLSAPSSCLKARASTPTALAFMSALERMRMMSMASSTSASALACSDLKNCSQASSSCSPKQRCTRGSMRSASLTSRRWCSRKVISRDSSPTMFSSSLKMSVAKASFSHSNAQFRSTFSVASRSFSSKLTMQGTKRAQTRSSTRNLRPRSTEARLTKMPPTIQRSATSFSSRAQSTSTRQPRLSPAPITRASTSSSFETLSSSRRASSSSSPLHSLSFTPSGSTSGRYSGRNSASPAKWISAESVIVVSLGEKTCLRRSGMSAAGANMRRAWAEGVYCRMALMVPCSTSGLVLPSSSSRSPTSSTVSAPPSSCSTSACYILFSSINNYISTTHSPRRPPGAAGCSFSEILHLLCGGRGNKRFNQSFDNFIMASPAKLFSCVEAEEICKSPLNQSPAKLQYSFSRSDRFKVAKPYCDNIYDLPSMRMTRKTSLGFGKKTDLDHGKHRHNVTPSPDNYRIDSFVDLNASHQRGTSAHIGRELTAPRSYIELDRIKFPGPGRYDELRYNETPKWTMRPVTNPELFEKTTTAIVPGPGTYAFKQELHSTGKYYASKYRSSGSKAWNPPSSQRFHKSTTDAPGSGNYFPQNDMSDSGKYVLSNNRGQGRRRLDQEFRGSFVNVPAKVTKTPGPGSYRIPSEFGQYDQLAANRSELA